MKQAGIASRYVEVQLANLHLLRSGRSVLEEVTWGIRPGERWVLAGANGAGKTQLLKVAAGSVWPTREAARRYVWQGESRLTPFEVQDEISYVGPERQDKYERYGWNHSVLRVIGTGLYRTDIPLDALTPADRRRIRSLLARLDVAHLERRPFLSLSYGERRLILLARALASDPKLLLLDELLSGLDSINHRRAMRWLEKTARSPLPWVLSTHRLQDVPPSATHALMLEKGRVVYHGPLRAAPLARWLEGESGQSTPVRASKAPRSRRRSAEGKLLVRLKGASVYLDYSRVLEGLSLEIRAGECWVVHGRNGSGKTTFLRTLYGDHGVAHGGQIERAGIEPGVPLEEFKRRVGLVAPHLQAGHPRHLTVAEVVQSGRYASVGLNDAATAADRAAARRSLAFFGLTDLAARAVQELSYGQLRRVLFARAWVCRPRLWLLDEPFAGIDAPTRAGLLMQIDALTDSGAAVVMSSHHQSEWPTSATHELELARGHARYAGPLRGARPLPDAPSALRTAQVVSGGSP
jgi:molybdate transport system ATP-binding protein